MLRTKTRLPDVQNVLSSSYFPSLLYSLSLFPLSPPPTSPGVSFCLSFPFQYFLSSFLFPLTLSWRSFSNSSPLCLYVLSLPWSLCPLSLLLHHLSISPQWANPVTPALLFLWSMSICFSIPLFLWCPFLFPLHFFSLYWYFLYSALGPTSPSATSTLPYDFLTLSPLPFSLLSNSLPLLSNSYPCLYTVLIFTSLYKILKWY